MTDDKDKSIMDTISGLVKSGHLGITESHALIAAILIAAKVLEADSLLAANMTTLYGTVATELILDEAEKL